MRGFLIFGWEVGMPILTPGSVLAIEGPDGCGKDTQIRLLKERLAARNVPAEFVREPGGTGVGEGIRKILMSQNLSPDPLAALFLFSAARRQLVTDVFRKAASEGKIIIENRSLYSSFAYQGGAEQISIDVIRRISRLAVGSYWPTRVILFNLPVEVAMERLYGRCGEVTRYDLKTVEYHRKVTATYLAEANADKERFIVIDATLSVEQVFQELWARVAPLLGIPE